jgi:outer membrane protein TolC
MRWITVLAGLALAMGLTTGCQQQCFLHECDYDHYVKDLGLDKLECDPSAGSKPLPLALTNAPTTILNPERPQRYISLAEAISIALENGAVNFFNLPTPGSSMSGAVRLNEALPTFSGPGGFGLSTGAGIGSNSDAIRVLALDPAITATAIEISLSKFDARWVSSLTWNTTEQPIGTSQSAVQALGAAALQSINTQAATFETGMVKPLPTGGVAGITFTVPYQLTNSPIARVNPSYTPTLQFNFEQPLLQGFGVEINQLRSTHPGGILQGDQFPTGGQVEGILITRLRFDQARADFERSVQQLVLNVEMAYWSLYYAYWDLYSNEAGLRQAYEAWKINNEKYRAGRLSLADFAQTRGQYELFRGNRIESLGRLLEQERVLRRMLGLPMEDCTRLVPSDTPTLAPYQPDWCTAQAEALALKPELVIAREELKVRQLDLINQRNLLLPDLRFTSTYGITGLGNHLAGGPEETSALHSLASDHFTNWSVGLNLTVPIGFREAHANVRIARLNLARSYYVLRDAESKVSASLESQYRLILQSYAEIGARRAQREAFADQLRARFQEYVAGRGTLDILLEAQRFWAQALASEYAAVADYNNALAAFEYAKGTILQHDNVYIAEGPLPKCAQVRAVEHERERTKALVLLERAMPVAHQPVGGDKGGPVLPQLPDGSAPSLPALFEKAPPPPPDGVEKAPPPRPAGGDQPQGAAPSGQQTLSPASGPATPVLPATRPAVQVGTPLPSPAAPPADPASDADQATSPAQPTPAQDQLPQP